MAHANATIDIVAKDRRFLAAMKRIKGALAGVKAGMIRVAAVAAKFAAVGTGAMVATGIAAVKAASDYEETLSKFQTVFGSLSEQAQAWSETQAQAMQRSKTAMLGYMATLQDTFVPFGFARDRAMELSQAVSTLGVDLASFNNTSDDEAIRNLTSALVGNHEAVRRFGVLITQATLDQELMRMGLEGGTKAATEQQKVIARLNLILGMTKDAQGDAIRTSDSFANQMKGLKADILDLAVSIGQKLMPMAKQLVSFVRTMVERMQEVWSAVGDRVIGVVTKIRDAWVKFIRGYITVLSYGMAAIEQWRDTIKAAGAAAVLAVTKFALDTKHWFTVALPAYLKWFGENWTELFYDIGNYVRIVVKNMWDNLKKFFDSVVYAMAGGGWKFEWTALTDGFEATMAELPKIAEREKDAVEEAMEKIIAGSVGRVAARARQIASSILKFYGLDAGGEPGSGPAAPPASGPKLTPFALPAGAAGAPATTAAAAGRSTIGQIESAVAMWRRISSASLGGSSEAKDAARTAKATEKTADEAKQLKEAMQKVADGVMKLVRILPGVGALH